MIFIFTYFMQQNKLPFNCFLMCEVMDFLIAIVSVLNLVKSLPYLLVILLFDKAENIYLLAGNHLL